MNKRLLNIILTLLAVLVIFIGVALVVENTISEDFRMGSSIVPRFVMVAVGLVIAFLIYYFTRSSPIWEVGTRQVVYMAIGAALYAVLSWLFNGSVFVVPSVSQVALRPAISIPMFFGYAFGPVVGFFSGAVGNMFGDALTGFGLSPQWSVGNGFVGMIAGLAALFPDKKKGLNTVLIVNVVLAAVATIFWLLNPNQENLTFFRPDEGIFGDQPITLFAGISIIVGLILVVLVRFIFGKDINLAAAVTWSMLGNLLGIGFAALSDIWINGYPFLVAMVGEFIPAAGPNLIFAAILVPLLVAAYAAVQRQSGR